MARAASFASAGSVVAVPTVRGHATPVSATGATCTGAVRSGPSCGTMLPSARSAAAAARRPASRPPTIADSSRAQTVPAPRTLVRLDGCRPPTGATSRLLGDVTPQARESTSPATVLCRTPRMRGIAHPRWRLTGSVRFREPGDRRWSSSAGGAGQMPDNDQRRGVEARGADHSGAARGGVIRIGRTAVTGWALASVLVVAGFGTAMGATPVAVAQPVAVADTTDTTDTADTTRHTGFLSFFCNTSPTAPATCNRPHMPGCTGRRRTHRDRGRRRGMPAAARERRDARRCRAYDALEIEEGRAEAERDGETARAQAQRLAGVVGRRLGRAAHSARRPDMKPCVIRAAAYDQSWSRRRSSSSIRAIMSNAAKCR